MMSNIASPWRYDTAALELASQICTVR